MKRNLESRVEVLVPIEDPRLQAELRAHARHAALAISAARGTCSPTAATCSAPASGAKHSQQQMIERTERRLKEATRLRRRKVQSTTSRRKR